MPFYRTADHPSGYNFWDGNGREPAALAMFGEARDQDAVFRWWIDYHNEHRLPIPYDLEARMEQSARRARAELTRAQARNQVRNDGPGGLFRINDVAINPLVPPVPRQRQPRQPARVLPAEYTPPQKVLIEGIKRKPFFMPYETLQEIRLRLRGSVIRFNGGLQKVVDVLERGDSFDVYMKTHDEAEMVNAIYSEANGFDLAPLPPRYVKAGPRHTNANWIYRIPARGVYVQGGNRNNTFVRRSGDRTRNSVGSEDNIIRFYDGSNPIISIGDAFKKVKGGRIGMPCSDDVAIVHYNDKYELEYHGMKVAEFEAKQLNKAGELELTSAILGTPSMMNKLAEVGVINGK